MKTKIYIVTFLAMVLAQSSTAQVIKNGSFESWNVTTIDNISGWFTSSQGSRSSGLGESITKVTGQVGNAIKIESKRDATNAVFGFVANTDEDPATGDGGIPYTQRPDSIVGFYKCNIASGDSGILIVVFKKNGAIVSTNQYKFFGTQTNFVRFAYKLNISTTPDSMVIGIASSNPYAPTSAIKNGSTITVDELRFTGTTQPIPNANFETWIAIEDAKAISWSDLGLNVLNRTTDKHKGNYAAVVETRNTDFGIAQGLLTNGRLGSTSIVGGSPYIGTLDTLEFYYKYQSKGNDTGGVIITAFSNGTPVGTNFIRITAAATYTKLEIPFQSSSQPDTLQLLFLATIGTPTQSKVGTKFFIDEVQLKSSKLNTGIANSTKNKWGAKLYPNPTTENVYLDFEANQNTMATYTITDILGKTVVEKPFEVIAGRNVVLASAQQLPAGVYFYNIVLPHGEIIATQKFSKQ